jgi:hypothetical protein
VPVEVRNETDAVRQTTHQLKATSAFKVDQKELQLIGAVGERKRSDPGAEQFALASPRCCANQRVGPVTFNVEHHRPVTIGHTDYCSR